MVGVRISICEFGGACDPASKKGNAIKSSLSRENASFQDKTEEMDKKQRRRSSCCGAIGAAVRCSARMWVPSPAWCRRLKDSALQQLWGAGHNYGSDLVPDLGISYASRQPKKREKTKRKETEREMENSREESSVF